MTTAAIVLLSGGLDSSLSLVKAREECRIQYGLTFDYGQRSAKREIQAARAICRHYRMDHKTLELTFLDPVSGHPFFDKTKTCPQPRPEELNDRGILTQTARTVWVPNRNGVFLNIAAALAEARGIQRIYVGFNAEEAMTFPDNSADFVTAINRSFAFSTLNQVTVHAPTIGNVKKEILAQLIRSDFPIRHLWSCYNDFETMCGACESCQRLKRAILENKLNDNANIPLRFKA